MTSLHDTITQTLLPPQQGFVIETWSPDPTLWDRLENAKLVYVGVSTSWMASTTCTLEFDRGALGLEQFTFAVPKVKQGVPWSHSVQMDFDAFLKHCLEKMTHD